LRNNFLRDKNIVMKTFKNFKNSIILLAIFLLCAGFSRGILRPANAALPQVESVFQVLTNPDVHIGNWVVNVGGSALFNAPLKLICGGEKDMDTVFVEKKPCLSEDEVNNMYAYVESGRMPGGLYSLGGETLSYIVAEPSVPTNLALFIDDIKKDTLFNTSSYAAPSTATGYSKPTEFFEITTLGVWQATRNIALALLGLFLAIAALGVLFRQKLSPQAVVTIYSILPSVPLAIIFIVLSYPLVAVAMNLAGPLNSLAIKLGFDVYNQIANASSGGAVGLTITAILVALAAAFTTGPFVIALSIPVVMMGIAILILIVVAIFKIIYEFIKWYGTFVILTIAFPIAAAVSILPGKQPVLMTFIKKMVVNMLVFPVGIFLSLVGFGFIMTTFDNSVGLGFGWAAYVFVFGIFVSVIKFSIGYGIIWNAFKIRGILENAFGATGSVMSAFSGGADDKKPGRR